MLHIPWHSGSNLSFHKFNHFLTLIHIPCLQSYLHPIITPSVLKPLASGTVIYSVLPLAYLTIIDESSASYQDTSPSAAKKEILSPESKHQMSSKSLFLSFFMFSLSRYMMMMLAVRSPYFCRLLPSMLSNISPSGVPNQHSHSVLPSTICSIFK